MRRFDTAGVELFQARQCVSLRHCATWRRKLKSAHRRHGFLSFKQIYAQALSVFQRYPGAMVSAT